MLTVREYLAREMMPSLGCTEPVAVALAAARASRELHKSPIDLIEVDISDSIYKNGMGVGVPGANGRTGNGLAAALGAIAGKSELDMQVLRDVGEDDVERALQLLSEGRLKLTCLEEVHGVYILVKVKSAGHTAECRIEGEHNNIVSVKIDGTELVKKGVKEASGKTEEDPFLGIPYEDLLKLADQLTAEDVDAITAGIEMNRDIARYGLEGGPLSGLGVGSVFNDLFEHTHLNEDLLFKIRAHCSAGSDARMAGCQLPVMTVAGSGNQGITSMLSVAMLAEYYGRSREEIAKAVMVSMLTTSFVRSLIGRVTPMCGCVVGAGAGAAAGMTYVLNGSIDQMKLAMQTMMSNLAGIVCDGAKGTCALRVGTAVTEAYLSALMAWHYKGASNVEGIAGETMETTARNVSMLNKEGMKSMDKIIIDIMEKGR